jgi:lysophospholipase L1-like esterase
VVGDSVAVTVAQGLEQASGLSVWNQGMLGCGLSAPGRVRIEGQELGSTPKCDAWPQRWTDHIRAFDPEVVVLLTGVWDGYDREIDGTWLEVGTPEFDAHYLGLLRQAISTLSSGGGRVVLLTAPYISSSDPNAEEHPASSFDPDRIDRLNGLIRQAAAEDPTRAVAVDLNAFSAPEGHYTDELLGVSGVRGDGVHFTPKGAALVTSWLVPQLLDLAQPAG